MFTKRQTTPQTLEAAKPVGPSPGEEAEVRLTSRLQHLVESGLSAPVGLEGSVGIALQRLIGLVQDSARKQLETISKLSCEHSETAINVGWVYHDFREVAQSTVSISSAVEEMAASITELSKNSAASASQAESARDTMQCCIRDSRQAVGVMDTIDARVGNIGERLAVLESAVHQIGGMAGDIDAIARQTNLLALNATIEAARAGEAGRGFAVVAQEVKALSLQTGNATHQIRTRLATLTSEMAEISNAVTDSRKAVSEGTSVVKQVGAIIENAGYEMSDVANNIRGLSELLEQQRAATGEISQNIVRISDKAKKTRDEVDGIKQRAQAGEKIALNGLDGENGSRCNLLPLIRLSADASSWKSELSSALLGVKSLSAAPVLDCKRAIAMAHDIAIAAPQLKTAAGELGKAAAEAQRHANTLVDYINSSRWDAATPSYVACQECIEKMISLTQKILANER